ncbi:MAG TPA: hypothetical protein VGJ60_12695 [Chloroflexota bacterium]
MPIAFEASVQHGNGVWRGMGLFLVPAGIYLAAMTFFPMFHLVRMSFSRVTPEVLYKAWPFAGLDEFQTAINLPVQPGAVEHADLRRGRGGGRPRRRFDRSPDLVAEHAAGERHLRRRHFVWAMPPLVNASVWRFLLDQRGLVDSIPAVFHIPPVLWLADGRLPLVAVALVNAWAVVVLGVVTTFYAFRSFDFIFIMTSGGPSTVSTTLP